MDLKTTIIAMLVLLAAVGVAAICAAVFFGKRYQDGGTKNQKYICVCCSVAGFVCIVTAVQIFLMFRNVLINV
ncbi:MAG: hypothetical protein IIV26_07480 [Peptococcaceae bacterium]|jgi:hypothetical protein|nr:hypothetical protein [Peptococcaceae bacterium]MBQ2449302.1 hypothetical protein [Peptococcaceae bacterium]MBQ5652633.1 hypothetical protein [Peptococcaceae bacterium]MBQ5683348.1 hypothetical protein [Peptococcaceae bacterium]